MPNWCDNNVNISGPKKIIKQIQETNLSLQKLFPCPAELNDTISGTMGNGKKEQNCFKIQQNNNLKKYGAKDWYDWNVSNWGTKWDIDPSYLEVTENKKQSSLQASFTSAWGPPLEAFKNLARKYPNINITLHYIETGASFAGTYRYTSDGQEYDQYIDYRSLDELEDFAKDNDNYLAESEVEYIRQREEEEKADAESQEDASA